MPLGMLVGYSIFTLFFAWILFRVGLTMWRMQSVRTAIERFEANPAQGSLTEKYFYGWIFPINRNIMKGLAKGNGDKLITLWYKASGAMFIVFALFFILGAASMWYANLTGM